MYLIMVKNSQGKPINTTSVRESPTLFFKVSHTLTTVWIAPDPRTDRNVVSLRNVNKRLVSRLI